MVLIMVKDVPLLVPYSYMDNFARIQYTHETILKQVLNQVNALTRKSQAIGHVLSPPPQTWMLRMRLLKIKKQCFFTRNVDCSTRISALPKICILSS